MEFWGRPMRVFPKHGQIRPLTLIGRALARERIGLWLMARAIARAAPPDDDPGRPDAPAGSSGARPGPAEACASLAHWADAGRPGWGSGFGSSCGGWHGRSSTTRKTRAKAHTGG